MKEKYNSFLELIDAAQSSGESLDNWLAEAEGSETPETFTKQKYIKELFDNNKEELQKLNRYNFHRVIKEKVHNGERLTDKEHCEIINSRIGSLKEIDSEPGIFAFGSGFKKTVEFTIFESLYNLVYFSDTNNNIITVLGYVEKNRPE